MNIVELATKLDELDKEIDELSIDMFADVNELNDKKQQKKEIEEELLFYTKYLVVYEKSDDLELDTSLLYPFKKVENENNEVVIELKTESEYKEDVNQYLEEVQEAYNNGRIEKKETIELKQEVIELANEQMEEIQEEKNEQEDVDIQQEFEDILFNISETKKGLIVNRIGQEAYGPLTYEYKKMTDIEKKELLQKTHTDLCKEMKIAFNMDFVAEEAKYGNSVDSLGYSICIQDLHNSYLTLDHMILEQAYKLHMGQVLNSNDYSNTQKEELIKMLNQSLYDHKNMVLSQLKKRELYPHVG